MYVSSLYSLLCFYSTKETDIWNSLLSLVDTTYVFIGRGVLKFTEYTRLDILLNTITETAAVAVSSSTSRVDSGQVLCCKNCHKQIPCL